MTDMRWSSSGWKRTNFKKTGFRLPVQDTAVAESGLCFLACGSRFVIIQPAKRLRFFLSGRFSANVFPLFLPVLFRSHFVDQLLNQLFFQIDIKTEHTDKGKYLEKLCPLPERRRRRLWQLRKFSPHLPELFRFQNAPARKSPDTDQRWKNHLLNENTFS